MPERVIWIKILENLDLVASEAEDFAPDAKPPNLWGLGICQKKPQKKFAFFP